jgi:hypothetical protein
MREERDALVVHEEEKAKGDLASTPGGVACGDRATMASPRACMRAGRYTRPWAVLGRWQVGPTNLNFSINFEISTNIEIQNKGVPNV